MEWSILRPFRQADYEAAQAADPGGDPNPPGFGGAPVVNTYAVGADGGGFNNQQTLNGTPGVADTFVFQLGNYDTTGTTSSIDQNPGGLSLMNMATMNQYDMLGLFEPGTDKIKINGTTEQGLAPISALAEANLSSVQLMGGWFLVTEQTDIVVATTFEIVDTDLTVA